MTSVILTCDCADTPAYAKDAFSILRPNTLAPELYAGEERIATFASASRSGEISAYAKNLTKNKEKFAILFDYDKDGHITTAINLFTGRRIQ